MTDEQFRELEKRVERNRKAHRASPGPKPEQVVRHDSLGKSKGEESHASSIAPSIVVRIISKRKRLLDLDNLTGGTKYFIDGLRYAGLIPGDRPDQITLEVSQEKVAENERTEILIQKL